MVPRIALIDVLDPSNADDCENIGQAGIAALLRRQGCEVALFSLDTPECAAADAARIGRHDLFGFSIYPNTADAVFVLAGRLKAAFGPAPICAGGQLATAAAAELLRDCPSLDACVLGEGEGTMQAWAQALANGTGIHGLPGLRTREPATATQRPVVGFGSESGIWPARDLLAQSLRRGNPTARLSTTRGCVAACEFCAVNGFHGQAGGTRWRGRNVADVVGEIRWITDTFGVRSFVFNDASFEDPGGAGRRRVASFCEAIEAEKHQWAFRCAMRAETVAVHGHALLPAMRHCGFTNVFIGIEAGNDEDLQTFAKLASADQNAAALEVAAACDMDVTMGFIMFQPQSTPSSLRASFAALVRHGGDKASHFTRAVDVYFGTPLHRRLAREGMLTADFSYRNPLGYYFACREVAALAHSLEPVREHPEVGRLDGRMYHLGYTISALRALYPEAAAGFVAGFAQLRRDVADLLAYTFSPVFEGEMRPLTRAEQHTAIAGCAQMNVALARFGSRVLCARPFSGYFGTTANRLRRLPASNLSAASDRSSGR